MNIDNVISNLVEVELPDSSNFLKIKETLTRIGLYNKEKNSVYQTCHILQKRQKYYIVHFKELFMLDGKESTLTANDIERRNAIVDLLAQWELIDLSELSEYKIEKRAPMGQIKVVPFKDKSLYNLVPKYTIGKK